MLCNIWKKYEQSPQKVQEEMTLEDVELIFNDFDLSWLSLTGGEPFLRHDLVDIITIAENHNPHLNLLTIPTNGSMPRKTVHTIEHILEETTIPNVFCTVSLDGTQKLHDQLRGVKGIWNQARECYHHLKGLEDERFRVFIEFTLSQHNAGHLLDTLHSFGVTDLSHVVLTAAHASYFYGTHGEHLHTETSLAQIDQFISLYGRGNLETIIPFLYIRLLKKYLTKDLPAIPCVSGRSSFFLDPYGVLYPCITMEEPFGNLRECPLNQILHTPTSKSIRKKIREGNCPGCWTPCEAYQTILEGFPMACKAALGT
jgi:MoaA/NifB/PqqE/SkfB family radical SAM enzyme